MPPDLFSFGIGWAFLLLFCHYFISLLLCQVRIFAYAPQLWNDNIFLYFYYKTIVAPIISVIDVLFFLKMFCLSWLSTIPKKIFYNFFVIPWRYSFFVILFYLIIPCEILLTCSYVFTYCGIHKNSTSNWVGSPSTHLFSGCRQCLGNSIRVWTKIGGWIRQWRKWKLSQRLKQQT